MDFISLGFNIFSFLENNLPGYVASIAASVTYDSAKSTDFDIQRRRLIETVFSEFCPAIGCEFNATVTVNSFYDALSNANRSAIQDDYILKEVICKTLHTELTIEQYAHWIKVFCLVCTNPDNQWIMNYIDHDKKVFQSKDFILENIRAKLLYYIGSEAGKDFGLVGTVDEVILSLDNVFQTSAWKEDLLALMRSALPDSIDKYPILFKSG